MVEKDETNYYAAEEGEEETIQIEGGEINFSQSFLDAAGVGNTDMGTKESEKAEEEESVD